MAGDIYRRVVAGEKFKPTAAEWNAIKEATRITLQSRANNGPSPSSFLPPPPDGCVYGKASSDLAAFTAVVVSSPLLPITSGDAAKLDYFKFGPRVFSLGSYSSGNEGKYGLTQEPIKSGEIGLVRIAGLSPALITVSNATYVQYARPQASPATKMKAGSFGSARIVTLESGTGDKWGYVILGQRKDDVVAELAASLSSGGTSASAVVKIGSTSTGETVTVFDQDTWIGATALASPTRVLGRFDFSLDQLILKNWKCPT